MSTRTAPPGPRAAAKRAGHGLDRRLVPPALVEQECRHAARAVAAGLDLAAVGIADFHEHVAIGHGRAQHHELVAAYAGAPVGHAAVAFVGPVERPGARIQHDEIIAEPVHLDEGNAHGLPATSERRSRQRRDPI